MPDEWMMYRRDERHTGLVRGIQGRIPPTGPVKLWDIDIAPPVTQETLGCYRFYSGLPLVSIDSGSMLDVIVTGPDNAYDQNLPNSNCSPEGGRNLINEIRAIRMDVGQNTLRPDIRWRKSYGTITAGQPYHSDWFDQYSAAAIRRTGIQAPEIVFTSRRGVVRAINSLDGNLVWEHNTQRGIEAGPMIADIDRNRDPEIIVVTGSERDPLKGAVIIYPSQPTGPATANTPLCTLEVEHTGAAPKLDSGEPAIIDLTPQDDTVSKIIVFGGWTGYLYALWFDFSNQPTRTIGQNNARWSRISLEDIAKDTEGQLDPNEVGKAKVRTSPLVWPFNSVETAIFGWMTDINDPATSRLSAVSLTFDTQQRKVLFHKRWTKRYAHIDGQRWPLMDWKPSVGLLPIGNGEYLIASAGGTGGAGTGNYGVCDNGTKGWVGAFYPNGEQAWAFKYEVRETFAVHLRSPTLMATITTRSLFRSVAPESYAVMACTGGTGGSAGRIS
jgi:hypothetical protein